MGWYYSYNSTRRSIIAELTTDTDKFRTVRKYLSGNTMWAVQENVEPDGSTVRFIACYLIQRARRNEWGYKPLEESMGPCEVSCPLAFLDMVPDPGMYATEWRARVRAWHAARKPILAARRLRMKQLRKIREDALRGIAFGGSHE